MTVAMKAADAARGGAPMLTVIGKSDRAEALTTSQEAALSASRREPDPSLLRGIEDFAAYVRDVTERSVLFWDTLRQRADNMLAHERAGKPPLLDFDYEVLLDARRFEHPTNYSLLRITRVGEHCLEDCLDANKPPIVILDARAGHGPGIGGFKHESEVGLALEAGHSVYFVAFAPEPVPGQSLRDVLRTLRRFVEAVAARHPENTPVLYGNCQAGWAIALLSADCAGLVGPAVLNGSPLSYWAGEPGVNPMRIAGGLVGGAWLVHLLGDLGQGRFDGAWLVQNFESLKPEAVWEKYANLFANIDTERDRFLEFERWWNGFYFLSREEIVEIVENLFVGNRLEQGFLRLCGACNVDLRRIRNPIVIFASFGDNITPPHQALAWIPALYRDTDDLKKAEQRIVYLTNPHVGHLGIFVSAKVAGREHRAIFNSLDRIEGLAPGLYEMEIGPGAGPGQALEVTFEERAVEDLRFPYPRGSFEHVRQVSEVNEQAYRALASPLVQALASPWSAAALEWLHPMRVSRYLFSESFSPWMKCVRALASNLKDQRQPAALDNPFKAAELAWISGVADMIMIGRRLRDASAEAIFSTFYGLEDAEGPTLSAPSSNDADATCAEGASSRTRRRR